MSEVEQANGIEIPESVIERVIQHDWNATDPGPCPDDAELAGLGLRTRADWRGLLIDALDAWGAMVEQRARLEESGTTAGMGWPQKIESRITTPWREVP